MSEEENEDLDDQTEIHELIKAALISSITNQKTYKKRNELIASLKAIISEYLDSFIVIGYDFEGRVIEFEGASSTQQKDALDTLLMRYFFYKTGQDSHGNG